eukprot:UN13786
MSRFLLMILNLNTSHMISKHSDASRPRNAPFLKKNGCYICRNPAKCGII